MDSLGQGQSGKCFIDQSGPSMIHMKDKSKKARKRPQADLAPVPTSFTVAKVQFAFGP
jgi:hypothetical protein